MDRCVPWPGLGVKVAVVDVSEKKLQDRPTLLLRHHTRRFPCADEPQGVAVNLLI